MNRLLLWLLPALMFLAAPAEAAQRSVKSVADSSAFTGTCTGGAPDYDFIELGNSSSYTLPSGCNDGTQIDVMKIDDTSGVGKVYPNSGALVGYRSDYIKVPMVGNRVTLTLGHARLAGSNVVAWHAAFSRTRRGPIESHRTVSYLSGGGANLSLEDSDTETVRALTRTDINGVTRHDFLALFLPPANATAGSATNATYINTGSIEVTCYGDDVNYLCGLWVRGGNYDSNGNPVCGATTGGVYDVVQNSKDFYGSDCRPIFLRPWEKIKLYTDGNSWQIEDWYSLWGLQPCRAYVTATNFCRAGTPGY